MRTVWLAIGLSLVLLGCASFDAGATPDSTVAALSRALHDGRADEAYAMMSDAYRRRVSFDAFGRFFRDYQAEVEQTARALEYRRGRAAQEAVVEYGEGERLRLVRESGGWRIASDVVNFYDQSSPRAALRSLVRSMERRRYDVVLELIPESDREGMSEARIRETWEGEGREEVERLLAQLRASLDQPIEEVGDRATMSYGDHLRMQFVREDGVWRIEDPE